MPIENLTFLEEGELTKKTSRLREVSRLLATRKIESGSEPVDTLIAAENIGRYVRRFPSKVDPSKFRERTAEQILNDGYLATISSNRGCTDAATLFIALARCAKIPTKYVELMRLEKGSNPTGVEGHVLPEVFSLKFEGWIGYDPLIEDRTRFALGDKPFYVQGGQDHYIIKGRKYFVAGVGLDSSQVYPRVSKRPGDYDPNPISLKSVEDLVKLRDRLRQLFGRSICVGLI